MLIRHFALLFSYNNIIFMNFFIVFCELTLYKNELY